MFVSGMLVSALAGYMCYLVGWKEDMKLGLAQTVPTKLERIFFKTLTYLCGILFIGFCIPV